MIRTLIADDEPLARELLASMLARHPDVELVEVCADGEAVLRALRRSMLDVLFLDVQMPELDGFEVLEAIGPDDRPMIVVVTAFEQHAVRAFEHEVTDYLLKPFDEERLDRTLQRVRQRRAHAPEAARMLTLLEELHRRAAWPERLPVVSGDRCTFVPVADVTWMEADGKSTRLHTADRTLPCRQGLARIEEQLDPSLFVRVNRSAIVRVNAVTELHRWFRGEYLLVLGDGTRLTTGKTYRSRVVEALGVA